MKKFMTYLLLAAMLLCSVAIPALAEDKAEAT